MFSLTGKSKSLPKTSAKQRNRGFADVFFDEQEQKSPQNISKTAKSRIC